MRLWLEKIYSTTFFPAIASLKDIPKDHETAAQLTNWMKQRWKDHGLETLKQQKNLMTEVRHALKKQLAENHIIFDYMRFTTEEWIEINLQTIPQPRVDGLPLITDPDAIVEKASQLLNSRQWANIIAGLTVVTGRRCAELLKTVTFSYQSPFSLWFTGTPKPHQTEPPISFELPTLAPAKQVMSAIQKIRNLLNTEFMGNRDINCMYRDNVVLACDRNFAHLIDYKSVEGDLYTQLSRTIYARIATYWYAPPQILDIDFMAAVQGHFIILQTKDLETKKSLAEKRHYFDHFIGDGTGKVNKQQGIRLNDPKVSSLVGLHKNNELTPIQSLSDQEFDTPDLERRIEPSSNLQKDAQKSNTTPTITDQSLNDIALTLTQLCQTLNQLQQTHDSKAASALDQTLEAIIDTVTELCFVLLQKQQPSREASSTSPPQIATPTQKKSRGRLNSEEADAKIHRAIDAILAYNNSLNRPHQEMWRIGISSLKKLTHSSQNVIKRVFTQRKSEIEAHHEKHRLKPYHNLQHGRAGIKIDDVITTPINPLKGG